jgi:flavin reductase (DIM6/NTAB) family NADH-FMN oxidoreductase RutF
VNEKTLQKLSYGMFVLTTKDKDGVKDTGCIVNTVMQVGSSPARIAVAVNKANYTAERIAACKKLTVSVLSVQAKFSLFERFGFHSGRNTDKFKGFDGWDTPSNGCAFLTEGTNAYLCGKVVEVVDLGSHLLFIAEVTDGEVISSAEPCTYAYYHANIKPTTAKNDKGQTVWRCTVCGYEYIGEELPNDFICPVCKHPASDFEKV